jgi:integrase
VWLDRGRPELIERPLVLTRAPEICIEILSPSNTPAEINEKRALYFDAGAAEVDGVEVIAPSIVEKLLFDALANDPGLVPWHVFTFFAGVRPEGEMSKLLWSDVDLGAKEHHVTIRPTLAKKRRKRWIDLAPNALRWLEAYRSAGGKMEGKVVPFSASTLRRKRRRNALAAGLSEWPQQGARHTYCSCWLRQHGDINKLVIQAGHESAATMWQHYYQAITPEAAAAFWSIFPPTADERRIVAFPG